MSRHTEKGTIVIGSGPNRRVVQEPGGSIKPEFLTNKPSTKTTTKKDDSDTKKGNKRLNQNLFTVVARV